MEESVLFAALLLQTPRKNLQGERRPKMELKLGTVVLIVIVVVVFLRLIATQKQDGGHE